MGQIRFKVITYKDYQLRVYNSNAGPFSEAVANPWKYEYRRKGGKQSPSRDKWKSSQTGFYNENTALVAGKKVIDKL